MSQPIQESPQEDIRAIETLLRVLEGAIVQGDPNILVDLFCREIGAVFSGTPEPVRGREAVTATWERHLTRWSGVRIGRRKTRVRIHGDVAWATFLWDGEGTSAGTRYRLKGERCTLVLLWEEGGWRVAQMHTSMPYRDWESHRMDA